MDLQHRFTVPTSVAETWSHFQDLGALAECFPGATIGEYDEESFTGSVKVKLGPIALVYNGSGTFVEKDEHAHRFVVDAKGKDKRGNGTAGATVTLAMADKGGSTEVDVTTDLTVTGKPAQFGRGVMQDVSDKLLGQFVDCLEQRLTASSEPAATDAAAPASAAGPTAAEDTTPGEPAPGEPAPAAPGAAGAAGTSEPSTRPRPVSAATPASSSPGATAPRAPSGSSPSAGAGTSAGPGGDEALDLGATVLPVLAKAYWKQGAAAALVLLVLAWWARRR